MPLRKDIWRAGLAMAPAAELLAPGALEACEFRWLPDPGPLRFLADPFGLWRDGRLHVFAEIYDYRDRIGAIDVLTYDASLNLLDQRPALKEPWHLSYPFVVEDGGETYMLPEAYKSGSLTLYRAEEFPARWTAVQAIDLDVLAIDATPVFHDGRWWLFYAPAGSKAEKVSALHVAHAPRLTGPWTPHPLNPVRFDASSSRPGGTPFVHDGVLTLPVQDCSRTYGGAIRMLRIEVLTPDHFGASVGETLSAPRAFAPYVEGMHTFAAAGPVTLVDAKRLHMSARTLAMDAAWQVRKSTGRRG